MAGMLATIPSATFNSLQNPKTIIPTIRSISLLSLRKLHRSHTIPKSHEKANNSVSLTGTAVASGAFFTTLASSSPALAAKQLAEITEGDKRGLAILLPLIPAVIWVLYNILGPALNQIERMRRER